MAMNDSDWFSIGFDKPCGYQGLREVLTGAEFTPAGIASALGRERLLAFSPGELPSYLHRTRSGSPHDLLIRLFLLEQPVPEHQLREALQAASIDSWIEAGLIDRHGEQIIARIRLLPYEELYLASDRATDIRQGARADFVMSLGHATELLAYAAIPVSSGETLDLGTGCGALGLLAASSSSDVLATDINPRAIAFTRFNARLNGIDNLLAEAGDMFAPATGRQFERIVCNPPFVIAPQARYIFRDSGRRGDAFCREVARAVPPLLAEGGYFQMLANCPHIAGHDWRADWQEWFHDLGCDCVVWANETVEASEYATAWIRDTESTDLNDTQQQIDRYDQWMRYYEEERIEAVSYGVVTMRRRSSGENFIVIDDTQRKITGACGHQIEQAFQWEDYLTQHDSDRQLLATCFQLTESAELRETFAATDSGPIEPRAAMLQLTGGVKLESNLDPAALEVIRRCDAHTPLSDMIPALAEKFSVPAENLAAALPLIVVQLARRGYLLPSDSQV